MADSWLDQAPSGTEPVGDLAATRAPEAIVLVPPPTMDNDIMRRACSVYNQPFVTSTRSAASVRHWQQTRGEVFRDSETGVSPIAGSGSVIDRG